MERFANHLALEVKSAFDPPRWPVPGRAKPSPAASMREVLERVVGSAFGIDPALLRLPTRGRAEIAQARQVAMYLAHTGFGLSLTGVGEIFERDRTTVAHACAVVEERRENPEFDRAIELLERSLRLAGARVDTSMLARQDRRRWL